MIAALLAFLGLLLATSGSGPTTALAGAAVLAVAGALTEKTDTTRSNRL